MKTFLLLLSVCALGHSFIDLPNLFNILHSRENLNAIKNKETLAKEINGYGTQEVELGKRVKRQEKTKATTASTATTKAGDTTATTKAGETTATTKAGETTAPPKGGAKPTEAPKSAGPLAPPAPAGVDPQVFSQYPLWRMYNNKNAKHRYVANAWGAGQLMEQGYHFEGASGSLIDYDMYNRHSDVLLRECPDLVLLRVFYSPVGTQFMTVDKNAAQWRLNHGWREQRPAGYCSFLQTCGANQSLRLVSALDGSDMVITTNSYELGTLNQQPRFKGTLSPTICWMW